MHARIRQWFADSVASSGIEPGRALEVGGRADHRSILRAPVLDGFEKVCINLTAEDGDGTIAPVVGSANDMSMFEDESFDIVASNAMLEHDPHFWLSVAEMKRVLKPGGMLFVGVPGFVADSKFDRGKGTLTFRFHAAPDDYWRFSEPAVQRVLLSDLDEVAVEAILSPPRIMGTGRKPTSAATNG